MDRNEFETRYGDILDNRDWDYDFYGDTVELQWYSPAGEDFNVSFSADNFADELRDFAHNFDAQQHAAEYWDTPGAPDLRTLLDDAQDIENELRCLAADVCDRERFNSEEVKKQRECYHPSGSEYIFETREWLVISDGVKKINSNCCYNHWNIEGVMIPNSVTEIGYDAFAACTRLESIEIPDSVEYIDSGAFHNCSNLRSVSIPDSVKGIGFSAFENCQRLKSITIPDSVEFIGDSAFLNCDSLKSVEISDKLLRSIDVENVFCGTPWLDNWNGGGAGIDEKPVECEVDSNQGCGRGR